MNNLLNRRQFLSRLWAWGGGLIAAAGAWTTWDLLRPQLASGFGGKVKTVAADAVPADSVLEVPAARAYLTSIDGEVVAIAEKCTHLGCRVPWCETSGQFECPCHGSFFNRAGDYRAGPAPRGMDRYEVEVIDGVVHVDTGAVIAGPAPGDAEQIDEPVRGPSCEAGGH